MKKVLLAVVAVLSLLSAAPVRADETLPAELEFERVLKPFLDGLKMAQLVGNNDLVWFRDEGPAPMERQMA